MVHTYVCTQSHHQYVRSLWSTHSQSLDTAGLGCCMSPHGVLGGRGRRGHMFMSACGAPPHPHPHTRYTFTVHKAQCVHYIQHSILLVELLHVYANIHSLQNYVYNYILHTHTVCAVVDTYNLYILIQCADPMCTYVYIYVCTYNIV